MPLIRCLGPIRLPSSYRQYMRVEAGHFKRRNAYDCHLQFDQELLPDPSYEDYEHLVSRTHHFRNGEVVQVAKPLVCPRLTKRLAAFYGGRQHHLVMASVEMSAHTDQRDDQINSTVLLIPHQASHLHFLQVEDERRQLLPNRIYAFNHYREHALVYDCEFGSSSSSKPLSVLKVRFDRMAKNSRTNTQGTAS
jgi:hypothetical protein